ncbi:hypothetical protein F5887DRAFT_1182194 [Amanita rubescens]|nr:hypothetical protein F5887DRAFT_1182194 [Amanita rubescens]
MAVGIPELNSPPTGCPYTVGTTLTLQSLSHSGYSSPTKIFTVNIENAYIPFTQSQVLKVKLNNLTPGDPEYAVLKLFDRRFFERPSHPWDQSKEDALLQFLADVGTGERKDDYDGKDSDDYEDWDWERKYRIARNLTKESRNKSGILDMDQRIASRNDGAMKRAEMFVDGLAVIDFALSRIRDEDETDEEWQEEVRLEDELHGMRLILHRNRFRDRTPQSPAEGFAGYMNFNRIIEKERPDWRSRHYEPIFREGGHLEMIDDGKGGNKEYHHAAWKLKA